MRGKHSPVVTWCVGVLRVLYTMVRMLSRRLKCRLATGIWDICGHVCIIMLLSTIPLALRKLLCVGMAMLLPGALRC